MAVSLTSVLAYATTYYVATTGSDNNNGTSLSTPFATIDHATKVVNPGDIIMVEGGTYTGGSVVTRNGTSSAWITLENYNGESVTWNAAGGDADVLYFYGDGNFDPVYWVVSGLEMVGGKDYVVKIDCPWVKVLSNNLHGSGHDLIKMVSTATDIVIDGNDLHNQAGALGTNAQAIDAVGTDRIQITHNYIHDTVNEGVVVKGNVRNVLMEDNRLYNIYSRGLQLGQATGPQYEHDGTYESYDGIIRNNIIINAGSFCLDSSSAWDSRIYMNSCYNVAQSNVGAIGVLNESLRHPPQGNTWVYISNNNIYGSNASSQPAVHVGKGGMSDNSTLYVDRNIYFNTGGASAVTFSFDDLNLSDVNITQWRSATGQDLNSMVTDPLYSDLTTLTISTSSPAVDAAICDSTHFCAATDYLGVTRGLDGSDIGAYETP